MDTLKKYNYEKEFDIETKGYSKKAKKSFRKCVEYETKILASAVFTSVWFGPSCSIFMVFPF